MKWRAKKMGPYRVNGVDTPRLRGFKNFRPHDHRQVVEDVFWRIPREKTLVSQDEKDNNSNKIGLKRKVTMFYHQTKWVMASIAMLNYGVAAIKNSHDMILYIYYIPYIYIICVWYSHYNPHNPHIPPLFPWYLHVSYVKLPLPGMKNLKTQWHDAPRKIISICHLCRKLTKKIPAPVTQTHGAFMGIYWSLTPKKWEFYRIIHGFTGKKWWFHGVHLLEFHQLVSLVHLVWCEKNQRVMKISHV